MNDADVQDIIDGELDWPPLGHKPLLSAPNSLIHPSWWKDDWYRDEVVYPMIRALIHDGYTNAEISERLGVDDNTARKLRGKMGLVNPHQKFPSKRRGEIS